MQMTVAMSVIPKVVGILITLLIPWIQGKVSVSDKNDLEGAIIHPHVYREPGCPIVAERARLNKQKIGGTWLLTYASMNWLADITAASFEQHKPPNVSEIRSLCAEVTLEFQNHSESSNTSLKIHFKAKDQKNNDPMQLRCWPQRATTQSKFECFFSRENVHTYVMIAATDHESWILLVRCKIGVEVGHPGEGMSWAILSKTKKLDRDTALVIFGLLEGYGFDLPSYKFENCFEKC